MDEVTPNSEGATGSSVFDNPLYESLNQIQNIDSAAISDSIENIATVESGGTVKGASEKSANRAEKHSHEHIMSTVYPDIRRDTANAFIDKRRTHNVTLKATEEDLLDTPCEIHDHEMLRFYCIDHGMLVCGVCVPLYHRACEHVDYIPEVTATGNDPAEQGFVQAKLDDLIRQLNSCKETIFERKKMKIKSFEKALADVKQFREEIIITLDRLQNELVVKAKEQNEQDLKLTAAVIESCDQLVKDIRTALSKVDERSKNRQYKNLYIALKEAGRNISDYENEVDNVINYRIGVPYFQRCKTLNDEIKNLTEIGKISLETNPNDTKASFLYEIDVMTEKDAKRPFIYGMTTLHEGKHLVALDIKNKSVKLIDLMERKVASRLCLADRPLGVTIIRQDKLAVTLVGKTKILFLKYNSRGLSKGHSVSVPGLYNDIHYVAGKFVLGCVFPEKSIHLLNLSGKLLRQINGYGMGWSFAQPSGITVNPDNNLIYVSDSEQHSITCIDMHGDRHFVYRNIKLQVPQSLATDIEGNIFICSEHNKKVIQVTPEGLFSQVLLDSTPTIGHPFGLALDKTQGLVYISSGNIGSSRTRYISVIKLGK